MAFKLRLKIDGLNLNDLEIRRIRRHLERLGDRLTRWSDPMVAVVLGSRPNPPGVTARIRLRAGHLGEHLIGNQSSDTADEAVQGALSQILRQLERQDANQRGEATFGVPSRRATMDPTMDPVPLPPASEPEER